MSGILRKVKSTLHAKASSWRLRESAHKRSDVHAHAPEPQLSDKLNYPKLRPNRRPKQHSSSELLRPSSDVAIDDSIDEAVPEAASERKHSPDFIPEDDCEPFPDFVDYSVPPETNQSSPETVTRATHEPSPLNHDADAASLLSAPAARSFRRDPFGLSRLAHKPTFFNLKTRLRQAPALDEHHQPASLEETAPERQGLLCSASATAKLGHGHHTAEDQLPVATTQEESVHETASVASGTTVVRAVSTSANFDAGTPSDAIATSPYDQATTQADLWKLDTHSATTVTMASQQPEPPIPYTRLKEITEQACEAALSGVTSYSHADTGNWNTIIINSVLGKLVEETSSQSPEGPRFKYVVNSTIIQHAASSSSSSAEENAKTRGRRGMHAASGAFWNNEKDGMWSFKYPGADSKGLDVVVGIIWVWVG